MQFQGPFRSRFRQVGGKCKGGRISVAPDCKRWLDFAERIRKVAPRSIGAGLILDEQLMFLFGAFRQPVTDPDVRRRAVSRREGGVPVNHQ
ncbi:hypothetical protein DIPPA_15479 [Diplonema papillatum]|nr:hypothetical protein DIPPA_15479 [Diplonema papillatum]